MNSTGRNTDIRWIVGGAVALLVAGMALIVAVTILVPDSSATAAALGGAITTGAAGIFALSKMNEKAHETVTKIEEVKTDTGSIKHQLNGDLDRRIRAVVEEVVPITVKEAVREALDEWTMPKRG